jgi:DNA helicase-2/ATP-dependent DNA helicase PcrA
MTKQHPKSANFQKEVNSAKFDEALQNCNPGQIEAINQIDGPVLVIAGPGTGKTQILSLRIGKILNDTDAKPHNILCLTYTDAGTVAMRKRLENFIGTDAYRVHIHTFHSFCNKVIQENMQYFAMRELQVVSDLESIDIMTELMDGFTAENPLKKYAGDIYYNLSRLRNLFSTMKSENWMPENISESIDLYLASLPLREKYIYKKGNPSKGIMVGDLKLSAIEEEIEKMETLRAAAMEFYNYEQLMLKNGRYDYQDMINWMIIAFNTHEQLLARYQEQYLYVLVDEFQDTNGSQSAVLNQLTGYWDNPNVFVVGDDDQSIYRFQGANLKNIEGFVSQYAESLKVVMLKENYRSTQNVLDASKAIIENNFERITNNLNLLMSFQWLEKNLIAQNAKYVSRNIPIHIKEYYNPLHEEADIVKQIESMHKAGEDLSEVAIIYRNHKNIANIIKVFENRKIPYNAKMRTNLLELPLVQNLLDILRYINEETTKPGSGEYLLFKIMHFEFFKISPRDIAVISIQCSKKDSMSWRELLASRETMFKLNLETASAISGLEANLTYWIKEHFNITIQMLFEKILTKGGIFHFILNHPDKIWLLEIINTLFDFIKDESAKNPSMDLASLIEMVDTMERNKISLPLHKIVHAENGVNLITAHSSKGLEFEHVFIINAHERNWEKKVGYNGDFRLPDTITLSVSENKEEEERRLFYVAMTRAKEHLQISYPANDLKDKEINKSLFVSEIESKIDIAIKKVKMSDEDLAEFTLQTLITPIEIDEKFIEKEFINNKLKNYRLSVTHLNKYLRCPLTYYFETVIQVPTARSQSMGFGNAIHYSLESLFKNMQASGTETFPSKEEFFQYFKRGLEYNKSHFTDKEFKLKLEYGKELLPEYYDFYIDQWNKIVTTEYRPSNVVLDNVPLSGALDKVEFSGNDVNVVDYKTGSPDNIKKKMVRPLEETDPELSTFEELNGGDYWRQVVFYKILLDNDRTKEWIMTSGEIDFVERRNNKEFKKEKVYITPVDMAIVKKQIKSTYSNILSHNFTGCGKEDCQWCTFVKNNYRSEVLVDEE